MWATSQVVICIEKGDLGLKIPLRSLLANVDFPNGKVHTGFILLDKTERGELNIKLLQSWSIQSKNLFPSHWLLKSNLCAFYNKMW